MPNRTYLRRRRNAVRHLLLLVPPLFLAACASTPPAPTTEAPVAKPSVVARQTQQDIPALPRAGSGRGGYYMDDGPADVIPEGLLDTPDAVPQVEPIPQRGNRPYTVFGKTYTPITDGRPFKQRGVGSWYGKKFHGQKTSSGEIYDMFKMTAAHPTLPIPSYVRVTNLDNGKQVIVRVNDRGPFLNNRVIDLSYTAALKLGYVGKGSGQLEVERLLPDEIERLAAQRRERPVRSAESATNAEAMPAGAAVQTPTRVESPPVAAVTALTVQPLEAPEIKPLPPPPVASVAPAVPAMPSTPVAKVVPVIATGGNVAAGVAGAAAQSPAAGMYFYLQFGAFGQAANAEAARARLAESLGNAVPPMEIVASGQTYRIFSGPFASRNDAAAAANRVQERGTVKPVIVQR